MRGWARAAIGIAVFVGAVASSRSARADALAEARDLHRQGLAFYDLGRYADAAAKIEAAFVLRDLPELLLDAGLAWRKAENYPAALRVYRGYLRRAVAGSPMIDAISECIDELQVVGRRANPRGCPREPVRIAWQGTSSPPTPPAPGPIDDEYEPPPSRRQPVASTPPTLPPPTPPAPVKRPAPVESAGPAVTVYDPWNNRITRVSSSGTSSPVAPARVAPPPEVRSDEEAPPPPPAPPPRAEPAVTRADEPRAPPKPVYKTGWFWATMALVAATVVGVGVGVSYAVPNNASSTLNTFTVQF